MMKMFIRRWGCTWEEDDERRGDTSRKTRIFREERESSWKLRKISAMKHMPEVILNMAGIPWEDAIMRFNRSHVSSSLSDFSLQMSQYHNVETDSSHHLRVPPKWKWGYLMQFRSAPKSFEGRGGGGAEILKLLLQNPPMRATYIGNLWSLYDGWTCQILCRKSSGLSMAVWRKTTPRHAESEGFSFKRGRTDYFGSCFIRESEKPALRWKEFPRRGIFSSSLTIGRNWCRGLSSQLWQLWTNSFPIIWSIEFSFQVSWSTFFVLTNM